MGAIERHNQIGNIEDLQRTAKMLALSGYFDVKGSAEVQIAQAATKIMAGREIGIGPFASMAGIHLISGKPAIGANLMASAVKGSGRYDYRVLELSDKLCRIEFRQRVGDTWEVIGTSEFSDADAKRAGTKNMDKFPKNMLFARAMSNGVRFYTPDIFSGNAVYVPEELGAEVDGDGNVVEGSYTVTAPAKPEATPKAELPQVEIDEVEAIDPDGPAPYYVQAWNQLTGQPHDLVKWVSTLHDKSDRPCTDKQYGFLVSLLDPLTNDRHGYALSVLCQAEISKDSRPGVKVASALLEILPTTVKDEGGQVVKNAAHRSDIAEMITGIAARQQAEAVAV